MAGPAILRRRRRPSSPRFAASRPSTAGTSRPGGAGMAAGSPVLGLRPSRGPLSRTLKLPKPEMPTVSPAVSRSAIVSITVSTSSAASLCGSPVSRWTASLSSARVSVAMPILPPARCKPSPDGVPIKPCRRASARLPAYGCRGGRPRLSRRDPARPTFHERRLTPPLRDPVRTVHPSLRHASGILPPRALHRHAVPRGSVGCQSAFNIDPQSACKIDPPERHGGGCPGSQ